MVEISIIIYETKDIYNIEDMELQENQVHVWKIKWSEIVECLEERLELLDEAEQVKSAKYRNEQDRLRYQTGKIIGKILAGQYLQVPEREISYCVDSKGKPSINMVGKKEKLEFNLSHSGDWVLIAFSKNYTLGIDVEEKKDMKRYDKVASKMFSELECAYVDFYKSKDSFYDIWTAKEAYTKAIGCGLSCELKAFSVVEDECRMAETIDRKWALSPITIAGYGAHIVVGHMSITENTMVK